MSHFINKCSCGVTISTCRCFSPQKIETVIENGCATCKSAAAKTASAIRNLFTLAGPHHECGKCFKWKKCVCPEVEETDVEEKEAGSYADAISLAMAEGHKEAECDEDQEAMEEPDQLAKDIKKKHRNKPGT